MCIQNERIYRMLKFPNEGEKVEALVWVSLKVQGSTRRNIKCFFMLCRNHFWHSEIGK